MHPEDPVGPARCLRDQRNWNRGCVSRVDCARVNGGFRLAQNLMLDGQVLEYRLYHQINVAES